MKTYTTLKGIVWNYPLTRKQWGGIRRSAWLKFDGSKELFDACWREYKGFLSGAIDDPESLSDVVGWLETIASEKVNNPNSRFYIYG